MAFKGKDKQLAGLIASSGVKICPYSNILQHLLSE